MQSNLESQGAHFAVRTTDEERKMGKGKPHPTTKQDSPWPLNIYISTHQQLIKSLYEAENRITAQGKIGEYHLAEVEPIVLFVAVVNIALCDLNHSNNFTYSKEDYQQLVHIISLDNSYLPFGMTPAQKIAMIQAANAQAALEEAQGM